MDSPKNDFWRSIINSLDVEFPEDGEVSPTRETLTQVVPQTEEEGYLCRIAFEMYVFQSSKTGRVFLVDSGEKINNFGKMSLLEAIQKVKKT